MSFNLNKYNTFQTTRLKDKKAQANEVTMEYTRRDKKLIHINDVEELYKHVEDGLRKKKILKQSKILITVTNGMNEYRTLKGFNEPLVIEDYTDYYDRHVKDTSKFEELAKVIITICKI